MKRHPALRSLSSDHHQGLVQARRLVKAAEGTAAPKSDTTAAHDQAEVLARVAQGFLAFWSEHTTRHFREEEEVLLPAFARYGDPSNEVVIRVLVEHIQIRRLVDDLQHQVGQGEPSAETMRAIGEMLRRHIRHEEDLLFPLIEVVMPEEELAALPSRLAAFDSHS
jgi:hemerythrin-like domain-containing protein